MGLKLCSFGTFCACSSQYCLLILQQQKKVIQLCYLTKVLNLEKINMYLEGTLNKTWPYQLIKRHIEQHIDNVLYFNITLFFHAISNILYLMILQQFQKPECSGGHFKIIAFTPPSQAWWTLQLGGRHRLIFPGLRTTTIARTRTNHQPVPCVICGRRKVSNHQTLWTLTASLVEKSLIFKRFFWPSTASTSPLWM